jgi:hypothetical protein
MEGRRIKLQVSSGRLPAVDLDTGEKCDWFVGAGAIIHMEVREHRTESCAMVLAGEGDMFALVKECDKDPIETFLYNHRMKKVLRDV